MLDVYETMRTILAVAQIILAVGAWRRFPRFSALMLVGGICDLLPYNGESAQWWRVYWMPGAAVRLGLMIFAAIEGFRFLSWQAHAVERLAFGMFGSSVAGCFLFLGAHWSPENWFQVFVTIRQYVILAIAAGFCSSWWLATAMKSAYLTPGEHLHGILLSVYFWPAFIMSTTGQGGLMWLVVERKGHFAAWAWINVVCMGVECALILLWILSIAAGAGPAAVLVRREEGVETAR